MRKIALAGVFSVFVVGGLLIAGDDKKSDPPPKGRLPNGWTKIGLSEQQKKDIYAIEADYGPKIEDLENQAKKLREERYEKEVKVLNEDQKKQLRDLKVPDDSSSASKSPSPTEK
jgi:hypothetical protein